MTDAIADCIPGYIPGAEDQFRGASCPKVPPLAFSKLPVKDWVLSKVQAALGTTPRSLRPIQFWSVEDADETTEGTVDALECCGVDELLGMSAKQIEAAADRPTPQFVWRVALAVKEATGFLPQVPSEWPTAQEEKLDIFWHIRTRVATKLHLNPVDVSPLEVLQCRNRGKTRWLLQLLAIAAAKEVMDLQYYGLASPMSQATTLGTDVSCDAYYGTSATAFSSERPSARDFLQGSEAPEAIAC